MHPMGVSPATTFEGFRPAAKYFLPQLLGLHEVGSANYQSMPGAPRRPAKSEKVFWEVPRQMCTRLLLVCSLPLLCFFLFCAPPFPDQPNRKSFSTFPSYFVSTSRGGPSPGGVAAPSGERRPTRPKTWSTAVACRSGLASSLSSPQRTQGGSAKPTPIKIEN